LPTTLVRQVDEIDATESYLVRQIGHPVGQPQIIHVRVGPAASASVVDLLSTSRKSRSQILERLDRFADDLLDGRLGFDPWPSRIPAEARIRSG